MGCSSSSPSSVDLLSITPSDHPPALSKTVSQTEQNKSKLEIIKQTPFSLYLHGTELAELSSLFEKQEYKKDDILFRQGDQVKTLYIVAEGSVDLYHQKSRISVMEATPSMNIIQQTLSVKSHSLLHGHNFICTKSKRDFICENTIFEPIVSTSTAIAVDSMMVLALSMQKWEFFVEKYPEKELALADLFGQKMEIKLSSLEFLSKVPLNQLAIFSNMFHYVTLKAGENLFEAGSIGQSMYVVYSGVVKAHMVDKDTREELMLGNFYNGSFFGEISLLVDIPRTANISAVQDTLLLELRKSDCHQMMRLVPELKLAFDLLMKERTAEHFRHYEIPFFTAIPKDKFSELADLCTINPYDAGTVIFQEGAPADSFYIITHGEISVRARKGEKIIELCRMGPGKYFGEDQVRSATVVTLDRCVLMSITKSNFNKFFDACPEALADFHVKLARYDIDLNKLIYHPVGRDYFMKYLESEFSSENMLFWLQVKSYRELPIEADEERMILAEKIVKQFIRDGSDQEINLNSKNKLVVLNKVTANSFPVDLFDSCEEEILNLMNADSFKRFKNGNLFQEFLKASETYSKLS